MYSKNKQIIYDSENNTYALKILNGASTVEEIYDRIKKFKGVTSAKNSFELLNNKELRIKR